MTKKYTLIVNADRQKFINEVNQAMAKGWSLQGGVSVTTLKYHPKQPPAPVFTQALILSA